VRRIFASMLLGFMVLAPERGLAETMPVEARAHMESVGVQVVVVRASREGSVDPRLRALQREMRGRGFQGLKLEGAEKRVVSQRQGERFELSRSYSAEVRLVDCTPSRATLRIAVYKEGALQHKADVGLPRNQGYITVVKPEGSRPALVLAITPQF